MKTADIRNSREAANAGIVADVDGGDLTGFDGVFPISVLVRRVPENAISVIHLHLPLLEHAHRPSVVTDAVVSHL